VTPLPAFWSVHDVSSATIDRASALVERLDRAGITPLTILVVPAGDWPPLAIEQLRTWAARGHLLAAHGWSHEAVSHRTPGHRVHSFLISRDAAEHLSRSPAEIESLVERSASWFVARDLPAPTFYIPPAWAVGRLPARRFRGFGFALIETLTGVTDTNSGKRSLLPLAGFEADTRFRAISVRLLNALNLCLARLSKRPIRVAVHPGDAQLLLHRDLAAWTAKPWVPLLPTSLLK
jgi:predicted deacetylase